MNEKGVNCQLRSEKNWFLKTKAYYWSGKYRCKHESCNMLYKAFKLKKISKEIILYSSEPCTHGLVPLKTRCTGELRKNMQLQLLAYGALNVKANNIVMNRINAKQDVNGY